MYIYAIDRHCTSNIAINISIFHLGLIRGARAYCPDAARRGAVGPTRPAVPIVEATAHRAELTVDSATMSKTRAEPS